MTDVVGDEPDWVDTPTFDLVLSGTQIGALLHGETVPKVDGLLDGETVVISTGPDLWRGVVRREERGVVLSVNSWRPVPAHMQVPPAQHLLCSAAEAVAVAAPARRPVPVMLIPLSRLQALDELPTANTAEEPRWITDPKTGEKRSIGEWLTAGGALPLPVFAALPSPDEHGLAVADLGPRFAGTGYELRLALTGGAAAEVKIYGRDADGWFVSSLDEGLVPSNGWRIIDVAGTGRDGSPLLEIALGIVNALGPVTATATATYGPEPRIIDSKTGEKIGLREWLNIGAPLPLPVFDHVPSPDEHGLLISEIGPRSAGTIYAYKVGLVGGVSAELALARRDADGWALVPSGLGRLRLGPWGSGAGGGYNFSAQLLGRAGTRPLEVALVVVNPLGAVEASATIAIESQPSAAKISDPPPPVTAWGSPGAPRSLPVLDHRPAEWQRGLTLDDGEYECKVTLVGGESAMIAFYQRYPGESWHASMSGPRLEVSDRGCCWYLSRSECEMLLVIESRVGPVTATATIELVDRDVKPSNVGSGR